MSKYSENMPPDIFGAIGWMYDHITPGSTFLDFGCSTGYFGSYIKQNKKCQVYGVEISNDKVEAAKVLDGVYSFDLDGEWPAELYERTYDYLFFGDVLEHLKDPADALKKTRKLLNKDGKIFVSVPNIAHISIRMELLKGDFIYEPMGILDNTHLQYFTLKTFTAAAAKAGFDAKLIDYTPNDIPKEILEKQLATIGLKPGEEFWGIKESTEARAYQYKFMLSVASAKTNSVKDATAPLFEKPLQFRDNIISSYADQLAALDNHSKEQAKIIDHFKNAANSMAEENRLLQEKLDHRPIATLKKIAHKAHHGHDQGDK